MTIAAFATEMGQVDIYLIHGAQVLRPVGNLDILIMPHAQEHVFLCSQSQTDGSSNLPCADDGDL